MKKFLVFTIVILGVFGIGINSKAFELNENWDSYGTTYGIWPATQPQNYWYGGNGVIISPADADFATISAPMMYEGQYNVPGLTFRNFSASSTIFGHATLFLIVPASPLNQVEHTFFISSNNSTSTSIGIQVNDTGFASYEPRLDVYGLNDELNENPYIVLTRNNWYYLDISWDFQLNIWATYLYASDTSTIIGRFAGTLNSSYFDRVNFSQTLPKNGLGFDNLHILTNETNPGENTFRFDEFTFQPLSPIDCQYNNVSENASSDLSFTMSGRITNPEDNTFTVLNVAGELIDSNNNATSFDIYTPDIEPNNMIYYSISSSTIEDLHLQEDVYKLQYKLRLKDDASGQIEDRVFFCNGTGVGSDSTPPNFDNWGLTFSFCTYPDCTGFDWITDMGEKLWCYMQNFGMALVCPSTEALAKSKAILTSIKSKFPYNYIAAAYTAFNYSQITTTTAATSTYMPVDLSSIPEAMNTSTAATGNIGILDLLKLFFTAILLILFSLWLIKFSHEIF